VRDSYFVATDGPESSEFYDVFLIDSDFEIERPRRAYRHGLNILSGKAPLKMGHHGEPHYWKHGDPVANITDDIEDLDTDNPMSREMAIASGEGKGNDAQEMKGDVEYHTSQHTFFITNAQRKLKLVARNAVSCIFASRVTPPNWHGPHRALLTDIAANAPVHRVNGAHRGTVRMGSAKPV
jgi:phospholipase D1/2